MTTPSPFVTKKEAAKMLGMVYETFRRQRAMGYLGELKIYRPTPKAREQIVRQSVLDLVQANTYRAE